jgi:2-polyprenyl-6-methoxyphenol hydroxylase-like FAD-dependent oxidoreductase
MRPNILIVGAGPVGLTLAIELTRYGIPVRILEKAAQRTDKSKALVLWSRTPTVQQLGFQASHVASHTMTQSEYQISSEALTQSAPSQRGEPR